MKANTKKILFVYLIAVLFACFGLCSCLSMLAMRPAETGRISNTELYAVKNNKNASIFLKTDDGYIMFDAGSNAEKFMASLNEVGISADEVKWIILSHSDYDHVASLPFFKNAQIFMSNDELQMINGITKRNLFTGNKLPPEIDIDKIILLYNMQELSLGGTAIKCIAAPGHTPGSMLYQINGKYLFTGDAFKIKKGKLSVHPFTMDSKLAKQTIERLHETVSSSQVVIASHYGVK